MSSQFIDQFADRGALNDDKEFIIKSLDEVFTKFKSVQSLQFKIETSGNFSSAAQSVNELKKAQSELDPIITRVTQRVAQYNGHSKEITQQIKLEAAATKDLAKSSLDNEKAQTQSIKNKQLLERYSASLTKEKEKLEKAALKEIDNTAKLNNAYEQLKAKYLIAATTAKQLAAEELAVAAAHGKESAAAQQAANDTVNATNAAQGYYNQLIKIEKSVGQAQRQVGQYTQATFALTQVLREAPAFANSFATGISGISNNVPILVDQFKILRSELGSGMKAFKVLAGSLLSFSAILPIAFLIIQSFGKEIAGFFRQLFTGKKSVEEITASMRTFGDEADRVKEKIERLTSAMDALQRLSDIRLRIGFSDDFERILLSLSGASIANRQLISDLEDSVVDLEENSRNAFKALLDGGSTAAVTLAATYNDIAKIPADVIEGLDKTDKKLFEGAINAQKVLNDTQKKLGKAQTDQQIIYAEIQAVRVEEQRRIDEEAAKRIKDLSEKERKAALELFKFRMGLLIEEQKILSRSPDQSTAIKARLKQTELEKQLIQGVAKFELAQADLTRSERQLIIEKESEDLKQAVRDREAAVTKIIVDNRNKINEELKATQARFYEEEQAIIEQGEKDKLRLKENAIKGSEVDYEVRLEALQQATQKELELNLDLYRKGKINKEQYEAAKERIEQDAIKKSLEAQIDYYEKLLQISDLPVDKQKEAWEKLNEARRKLRREDLKDDETITKELIEKRKELWKEVYSELENFAAAFIDAQYEKEKNAIQDQIDLLEAKKQKEIEVANQTIASTEERAAAIAIIEARANAQREQLERSKRKVQQDQAKFERAKQIFDIGIETAKAIFSIKAQAAILAANPVTAAYVPVALSQIPLVLGAAALQVGAILAKPIPRYKHGKNVDSYEGPAIVGDGGKSELHIKEDGSMEVTPDTPTLTYVKKNDIILPDANKAIENIFNNSFKPVYSSTTTNDMGLLAGEMKGIKKEVVNVAKAIKSKQEIHFKKSSISDVLFKNGDTWTKYISRNV